MPGVPVEMVEMMEDTVLPELAALAGPSTIVSRTLRCAGIGESRVAELLRDLFTALDEPHGRLPRVARRGEGPAHGEGGDGARRPSALLAPARRGGRAPAGRRRLHRRRRGRSRRPSAGCCGRAGRTLACAESLTGGGVAARLTPCPGCVGVSSSVGAVVYTAEAKRSVLGVSPRDARRAGRGERGVRPRDGRRAPGACSAPTSPSRSPAPPARSRTAAPSPAPCGSASTPRTSATRAGYVSPGSATGAAVGGAGRRSTWCGAISRACPCPAPTRTAEAVAGRPAAGRTAGAAVRRRRGARRRSRRRRRRRDRAVARGVPGRPLGAAARTGTSR